MWRSGPQTMAGCWVLVILVASAAAAPVSKSLAGDVADLPLEELAAQRGLTLTPRPLQRVQVAVDVRASGAQAYPYGMADPQPPQRSRQSGPADLRARAKRAADDIYDETRLPTNVVPTRYTVTMAPNLDKGTFYGSTDIYINVVEATSRIILHGAPDIKFDQVLVLKYSAEQKDFVDDGHAASFATLSPAEDLQRIVINLQKDLVVGEHYKLRFPLFTAYLRTDLKGFYLSSYKDYAGRTHRLATTQFEPPSARFAFPCFDEPALKARFKIIVEHDKNLFVKSNMPEVSRTNTYDSPTLRMKEVLIIAKLSLAMARTEFDETLPMSTYLLAWVVSDYGNIAATDHSYNVTTYGRTNLLTPRSVYLANTVAPQALRLLEEFTGIPYALPKVDQYAIPDFDAGAMENWGLVTYREMYLLETGDTTIRIREFIATTVCHELGHQWTGNLVTLDWWSNTWLNEGFATYFENVICDKIFPDWNLMDKYVTDNVHVGIANDVKPGQIAMSSPVSTTDAVETKFDRISYKKGGSVLRMFEHVLGTEVFKKAMNRYLSVNAFKSGTPDRLFHAMNTEAQIAKAPLPPNTDFGVMAKTWTEQAGVPVVTVTRNTAQGAATLTQEQFFYETPEDQEATRWYVPIPPIVNPKTNDWTQTAPAYWLTPDAPTLENLDMDASESEWILVNPRQIGYYLVNYDQANWKLLHAALVSTPDVFPAATRTQLVHDALAMARAGRLDYATALPFLQALKDERSPAAWKAGVEALAFLRDRLALTPASQALKAFIGQITSDAYDAVGFGPSASHAEGSPKDEERYLRYFVASYACYGGHQKCIEDAKDAVKEEYDSYVSPPADVREAAFCYALQNSDDSYGDVLDSYFDSEDATERGTFASALACTRNYTKLQGLMDSILYEKPEGYHPKLTPEDLQQLINAILSQWDNHRFMLDYYKQKYLDISAFCGSTFSFDILTALIDNIRTVDELHELTQFVHEAYPVTTSSMRVECELRLEAAKTDMEWQRKYFDEVSQWLYDTTGTGPYYTTETPTAAPTPAPTTVHPPAPTTVSPPAPTTVSPPAPTTVSPPAPTGTTTVHPPTPKPTPAGAPRATGVISVVLAASILALMFR